MSYEGMTEKQFRKIIPIGEIQVYEGNCWATTLSMMLRCHGFDFSQKYVTDLFREWRFDGVTSKQMSALVNYFNNNFLMPKGWIMKRGDWTREILSFMAQSALVQVFIRGHFILILGYDSDDETVTYFDPWDGSVNTVSFNRFLRLLPTETAYMYQE
jgi:hypothetical protein